MDSLAWGLPLVFLVLLCPLMMVGMALFAWFAVRLGFRRAGPGTSGDGHGGHMMCGPMMGHGSHDAPSEDEVSALRARVEGLERRLSEKRAVGRSH